MLRYIVRRLLYLIPVILGVLLLTFIIARVVPGDPIHLVVGPDADQALIDEVRREMHLDDPLWTQFGNYVAGILKGDLGTCYSTGNPVTFDLIQRLPATLELTLLSLLLCVAVAIPLGVIAAVKRDGIVDHLCRVVSMTGVAMPSFWLGLILIFFLFYQLRIMPPPMGRVAMGIAVHRVTGFFLVDTLLAGDWRAFGSVVSSLILPCFALAFRGLGQLTRLTRSAMIEVLSSDYVDAARAQGLRERVVVYRLALKNAVMTPLTQIGIMFGQLLGGAVLIETVFAWPGVGLWVVTAANSMDFNPVQGFVLMAAAFRVLIFLGIDLVHFSVDPRVRIRA